MKTLRVRCTAHVVALVSGVVCWAPGARADLPAEGTPPSQESQPEPEFIKRGKAISAHARAQVVSVGDLRKRAKELDGQMIALSGTVAKVCQMKGCWFTLVQADEPGVPPVRITSKGYLFFVPKDVSGYQAVVEGTFHIASLSPDEAAHFAADEARAAESQPASSSTDVSAASEQKGQSGSRVEWQFAAEGLELRPQS